MRGIYFADDGNATGWRKHSSNALGLHGTTKAENATAIGAGGNGYGQVTISGGRVTAVSTTAGTAIGGGMGHNANGGPGNVTITGGNIYAYNFANRWGIASAAIGGGRAAPSAGAAAI